jgi:hypothetical protein
MRRGPPKDQLAEIEPRYGQEPLVTSFVSEARPELVAAVERMKDRIAAVGLARSKEG